MKTSLLFLLAFTGLLVSGLSQNFSCHPSAKMCMLKHLDQDFFTHIPAPRNIPNASRSASFVVDTTGYPTEVGTALLYAADIWASYLNSPVPIKITFFYVPVSGFLGFTLPNGVRAFPGAPDTTHWYASALADAITGIDQNPGEADMTIFMTTNANWYFGLDGNTPAGMVDFVSVFLHEIGHGLGFVSLGKVESNGEGSLGELSFSDFSLPPLPVPFPDQMGIPGVFDDFLLHQGSGFFVTDTAVFPNPSAALGTVFTGNDLYFSGPYALAANNQVAPKIYAPSVYDIGSSLSHLDESTYPPGDTNTLMTPFIGNAEANHAPGPIMMGILHDLGWPMGPFTQVEGSILEGGSRAFPNPFSRELNLSFTLRKQAEVGFRVWDLAGREVETLYMGTIPAGKQEFLWQSPDLPQGLYAFQLRAGGEVWTGRILKGE